MQSRIHSHIIFRCQEEEHAKGRFSRSAFNTSSSPPLLTSQSSLGSPNNRRHYASYLPMTGQIDLIEEEIVLTQKVQNEEEKTQKNPRDYAQSLTHNTDGISMGDQRSIYVHFFKSYKINMKLGFFI